MDLHWREADARRGGREGMKMSKCGKCEGKGIVFADRHVSTNKYL